MCPGGQREELSWRASHHSGWEHLPGYSWGLREELFRGDVRLGVGGRQGAFGVCCPDRAGATQAKDLSGEQGTRMRYVFVGRAEAQVPSQGGGAASVPPLSGV